LINGVAVLTTRGPQTPTDLEGCACFVQTPEQALAAASDLLANPEKRGRLISKGLQYAQQYSWERIAEQHSALYHQLLDGRNVPEGLPVKNAERPASSSFLKL
jgi:glycosyltransferase involved in cell wall biosynthesis